MSNAMVVDVGTRLGEIASEIRSRHKRQLDDMLAIGRLASEAKSLLPHGDFTAWVEQTLLLSPTLIRGYMRVYGRFQSKAANFAVLGVSSLLLLASPAVSDGVLGEIEARLLDGQKPTIAEVEQIIATHRTIESAGLIGRAMLEAYGGDVKQIPGSYVRSLVQVADDASTRGMVTIDGGDYVASGRFPAAMERAIEDATQTRREEHIGDNAGEWLLFNNVPVAAMVVNGFLTLKIEGIERFFDKGKVIKRVKFLVDD